MEFVRIAIQIATNKISEVTEMSKIFRCINCNKAMKDNVPLCKNCESLIQNIRPDPIQMCIYGPPFSVKYTCPNCGHSFKSSGLGSPKMANCPKCNTEMTIENY